MGQNVTAIFYGCDATGLHLRDYEDEENDPPTPGLVDRWDKIPGHGKHKLWLDDIHPEGEGKRLLGFWVAVAGDPNEKPGAVELPSQMSFLAATKLPRVKTVLAAWPDVVTLAKKHGITLKGPSLWLVETEIA